jgi:hypothetical protein
LLDQLVVSGLWGGHIRREELAHFAAFHTIAGGFIHTWGCD